MASAGRSWGKSLVIGAASLASAWQAYDFSVVPVLRRAMPEMALTRAPADPIAIAEQVHARSTASGKYDYTPEDVTAARLSLATTPLSRTSVRIIGLDAAATGEAEQASGLLKLAHRLSRRDPWTEGWLLERAARTNDFKGVVDHFNAAVSVSPELAPALNPLLIQALDSAQVRDELRKYVRANAIWAPGFLEQASNEAPLAELAELVRPEAQFLSDPTYQIAVSNTVYRLAAAGRWDDAMDLAGSVWADFEPASFVQFAPSEQTSQERLGRLAWTFTNENRIETFLDPNGTVEVTLGPLARGLVMQRDFPVSRPGTYLFVHRLGFDTKEVGVRANWEIDCVPASGGQGRRIWERSIPSSGSPTTYRSIISVPAGCALVSLRLSGRGSDGDRSIDLKVSDLNLTRSR